VIDVRRRLQLPSGESGTYYSLLDLEKGVGASVSRLPVSLRILVESVLRQLDGRLVRDEDVEALVQCQPDAARTAEVPFVVARVLLQDFTGVPLLVDLAAMRSAVTRRCARRSRDRSLRAGRLLRSRRQRASAIRARLIASSSSCSQKRKRQTFRRYEMTTGPLGRDQGTGHEVAHPAPLPACVSRPTRGHGDHPRGEARPRMTMDLHGHWTKERE
jgi:hypothetical protein